MSEYGGDHSVHVAAQVDTQGNWVDDTIPNSKWEHRHPGYWPFVIAVEGGEGNH